MDTISLRDVGAHLDTLTQNAAAGRLTLITQHGQPMLLAVPLTDQQLDPGLRIALALKLYKDGSVDVAEAGRLAGVAPEAFMSMLVERRIPFPVPTNS